MLKHEIGGLLFRDGYFCDLAIMWNKTLVFKAFLQITIKIAPSVNSTLANPKWLDKLIPSELLLPAPTISSCSSIPLNSCVLVLSRILEVHRSRRPRRLPAPRSTSWASGSTQSCGMPSTPHVVSIHWMFNLSQRHMNQRQADPLL